MEPITYDLGAIFNLRNLIIYLLIINIIGFFAMLIDKKKAKRGAWRIPENTLFTITFLGGGVGTIAGMYAFRHKTQKLRFTIGFPTIFSFILSFIFLAIYIYVKYFA